MKKEYIKPESKILFIGDICETPGIAGSNSEYEGGFEAAKGHDSWGWDMWGNEEELPEQKSLWDD